MRKFPQHHCRMNLGSYHLYRMVDRCFALWQALYPDSYVQPQQQSQGNYWYNQGSVQDVNSRKWIFTQSTNLFFVTNPFLQP
jgi:tyrosinase